MLIYHPKIIIRQTHTEMGQVKGQERFHGMALARVVYVTVSVYVRSDMIT